MKNNHVALIGCGRIGFLLEKDPLRKKPCTHAGGATAAGITITHAVDTNSQRLNEFKKRYNLPAAHTGTDYKELLKKVRPACVIIATWTESHAEIAIFAARNGARIIVLEKPVSYSLKSTGKLLEECEANNCKLIINHERRYDPRYQQVKKLIENRKIGTIKSIHATVLTGPYRGDSGLKEGGGPLLHDGTHIIDIIRFFIGDISEVSGDFQRNSRNSGFEDQATAWLKSESGVDIFLESGGSRNYFQFELTISGTEGKITIGNGYQHLYTSTPSRFYKGFRDLSEKKFPGIPDKNCFVELYREVKGHLNQKTEIITSTGLDGYKSLEIIHGIYLSASKNRKKISLPVNRGSINLKRIFDISE